MTVEPPLRSGAVDGPSLVRGAEIQLLTIRALKNQNPSGFGNTREYRMVFPQFPHGGWIGGAAEEVGFGPLRPRS
jgi:hypothetical protein